jgi:protein required for attachment to host cells
MKRLIRHAWVLVTDGGRALLFRNEGDAVKPDLRQLSSQSQDVPPTRELGTSKPPRTNDSLGRRSAMEAPDLHQMAEDRFIAAVAADLDRSIRAGEFEQLLVAAPPVALGQFRKAASPAVMRSVVLELDKDLTKHPPVEITKLLVKALEEA